MEIRCQMEGRCHINRAFGYGVSRRHEDFMVVDTGAGASGSAGAQVLSGAWPSNAYSVAGLCVACRCFTRRRSCAGSHRGGGVSLLPRRALAGGGALADRRTLVGRGALVGRGTLVGRRTLVARRGGVRGGLPPAARG